MLSPNMAADIDIFVDDNNNNRTRVHLLGFVNQLKSLSFVT